MSYRITSVVAGGLVVATALGGLSAGDKPAREGKKAVAAEDKGREADIAANRKSSRDYATAFEKGDAKAVAAFWTEQGEYHHPSGGVLRGRAAIEEAATAFFKAKPSNKIEIIIDSIRFLTPDLAIEEGIQRQL